MTDLGNDVDGDLDGYDGAFGYPDVGQPCGGKQCDGRYRLCDDCGTEVDEWRRSNDLW